MSLRRRRLLVAAAAVGWAVSIAAVVVWWYDRHDLPYAVPLSIGLAVVPALPVFGYVLARPTDANLAFRGASVAAGLVGLAWTLRYMNTSGCQIDAFCGSTILLPPMADIGAFVACRAGRGLAEQRRRRHR